MGPALLFSAGGARARALMYLPPFSGLRAYPRVGMRSGANSAIRNVAHFAMIIRMVNSTGVGEMGGYCRFVQVMWGLLLVSIPQYVVSGIHIMNLI